MKKLYPFQKTAVKWLTSRSGNASLLCLEQGLGKTVVTTRAMEPPVTIVCPSFLQYNWYDEVVEHGFTATLVRCQADLFKDVDVFIMSFHFLTTLDLAVVDAKHFVVDEFHFAKSLEAKRTQAVLAEIECVPTVTLLSGTPIPSRPVELYPILDAIGAYTRGYYSFVYRFCAARQTHYGLDVNGASNLDQLAAILAPWMLRYTKKSVLKELPDKVYRVLSLDIRLPPEEKAYDLEEFRHVAPDVAFNALSTVMRIHAQLKFPHVRDVVDHYLEIEDKLIVFGHHLEEMINPLIDTYADTMNAAWIVGGMSAKKKKEQEQKFQTDPTCRIILIGIMAGGVGICLTAGSHVILAESSWVPGVIDQAADRPHRIGQTKTVHVDLITIRGSIDEYQLRRALEKMRVINEVIKESDLPMDKNPIAELIESLREKIDELETNLSLINQDIEGLEAAIQEDEEEEEKPTRRGRRGKKDEAPPARGRRGKKVADEDEEEAEPEEGAEEEEERPTRRSRRGGKKDDAPSGRKARGKKVDDEDEEEEEEEEEKPTRTRRGKKDETPPARGRRGKKDEAPAKGKGGKKSGTSFDDVRAKASELMAATNRAELIAVLGEFDATKVSELTPDQYEEFIVACDEALE